MDAKKRPGEKIDSNFTLSKSELSNADGHHRYSKSNNVDVIFVILWII